MTSSRPSAGTWKFTIYYICLVVSGLPHVLRNLVHENHKNSQRWLRLTRFQDINFTILQSANSCQHLNFGLRRQNIASHWNFLYSAQKLHCHRPVSLLSIQSKTWLSFLSSLAEWAQKYKFLKLAVLWSNSMKRNFRQFIFKYLFSQKEQFVQKLRSDL